MKRTVKAERTLKAAEGARGEGFTPNSVLHASDAAILRATFFDCPVPVNDCSPTVTRATKFFRTGLTAVSPTSSNDTGVTMIDSSVAGCLPRTGFSWSWLLAVTEVELVVLDVLMRTGTVSIISVLAMVLWVVWLDDMPPPKMLPAVPPFVLLLLAL
uniref:Uncharacterized protein n=1 Tax=Anopheles merus TaxID=30066 RepID=A0A182US79_ANOME